MLDLLLYQLTATNCDAKNKSSLHLSIIAVMILSTVWPVHGTEMPYVFLNALL